jgi:glutamate/aspartate transport system substrate-binding protein
MLTIARIMSWAVCLRTGLLANSALAGAARPTRRTASTRPIVILVLCGAFLIARVVSVIALILSNLRHHAIEQSKQQLLATATVLARQAARDFQSIDLIDANLICDLVADAVKARLSLAKLEVKLVPITPSLRVPYILSEKIDLACETMTNNLEQQKVVAFSSTYFIAANRFVSKMAANLKTLDDLKGRTVVSTIGSTNLSRSASSMSSAISASPSSRPRTISRRSACWKPIARPQSSWMISCLRHRGQLVGARRLRRVGRGAGILLRPDDPAFKKVADDALAAIYRNGDINRIYAKWFLNPIPPNGVDLNVPMSAELKRVIANPTDSGDPQTYTIRNAAK